MIARPATPPASALGMAHVWTLRHRHAASPPTSAAIRQVAQMATGAVGTGFAIGIVRGWMMVSDWNRFNDQFRESVADRDERLRDSRFKRANETLRKLSDE